METECVLSLGDQRWTLPPGAATFTLGRASNADLRLQADDQISRIHARLTRDGDAWTLHDESRNGTGLNGHRITAPTPLTTGDRIHIGRSILTFHATPTDSAAPVEAVPPQYAEPAAPADPVIANRHATPADFQPAPPEEPYQADLPPALPEEPYDPPAPPEEPYDLPALPDEPYDASAPEEPYYPPAPPEEPYYPPASAEAADSAPVWEGYSGDEPVPGAAGVVPGFEAGRAGDGGTWASYPSADNPEPVRSPSEISARLDHPQPNWNESDSWPAETERRTTTDRRTSADRRAATTDRRSARLPEQPPAADRRTAEPDEDVDAVGAVRLPRVLIAAGGVIVLGLIVNLIDTFLSDGPGGALRWLVPPGIALVVAMVLTLIDAAAPKEHRPGRFHVPVAIAIAVVLVGIGVGGFALTAGTEYVAGYLTGNEAGADRLVKPVAKARSGITVTVENVTYTSHFTRIEVLVANGGKQAFTIPIDGTTFTAADGTALHADTGKSAWPSRIAARGSEHGTITFTGHLPDSATTAVLTFKSGNTTFAVSGVLLSK